MQYVMVDEFQDVSKRQYRSHRNPFGKAREFIHCGRPRPNHLLVERLHVKLFLDFDKVYPRPDCSAYGKLPLKPQILAASNSLIEKNRVRFPKSLTAVKDDGRQAVNYHAKSEKEEAAWIHAQIEELQ